MKFNKYAGPEGVTQIPMDAEAWQLYSDMKGVGQAARRLTGAIKRAIRAKNKRRAVSIMREALEKERDFGAIDTEPRGIVRRCLSEARTGDEDEYDEEF